MPKKIKTAKEQLAGNKDRKAFPSSRLASASKKFKTADVLRMYSTPAYTDSELEYFEDAWSSSIAGTAIDKLIEYAIGGGVKPTFELIDDQNMDEEQVRKELEKYDGELNELIHYDQKVNWNHKLADAATMARIFGRCVLTWEGKGLPQNLKIIHPRDTGRVFIKQEDWGLEKVYTTFPTDEIYPDEMVYFVNKPDSPRRRTMWYGYSDMQRVVGAARAWRRIIEFDMPEIATAMWAGYGMFIIKKLGRSKADAELDANTLLNSLNPGAFNAVTTDAMDEIEFKNLDLDPKVKELVELASFYERIIIGNYGVPSALLGREEDQNRATLIGKIQFFLEGPVKAMREWMSHTISPQWYERNMVKMGMGELLSKVRVKAEFEPIIVESWYDLVDAVMRVKAIFPHMPDNQLLELLNLEEFKQELELAPPMLPQQNVALPGTSGTSSFGPSISASKQIDSEVITTMLNAKRTEVLEKIERLIDENGSKDTKHTKGSTKVT